MLARQDVTFEQLRARRPLVVVDLNYLRRTPAREGLPGTFAVLIPDAAFYETVTGDNPSAFVKKYESILVHPSTRGRVLLGRYWDDIAREEHLPRDIRSGPAAVINEPYSRSLISIRSGDLSVPDIDLDALNFTRAKREFVDTTRRFADWLADHPTDPMPTFADDDLAVQWIEKTIGDGSTHRVLARLFPQRFDTRRWEREHRIFPDRGAMARWIRVLSWYCFRRASKPSIGDSRFGNSYEDMHYVFSSLYTGHLLTGDKDLAAAAKAVSGNRVAVYTHHQQVAQHGLRNLKD